jgi:hypothetical protein
MTVIEMPLPMYDNFVEKCDPSSREYAPLKNSVIVRRKKDDHCERVLEITCDLDDARRLLVVARQHDPDAVLIIERAIANPR